MSSLLTDIRRRRDRGIIAGVCAGIADYFDWNVKIVRIVTVLLLFTPFNTVILITYGLLWYILDPEPGYGDIPPRHWRRYARRRHRREHRYADDDRPTPPSVGDVHSHFERLDERLRHLEECIVSNEYDLRREFRKLES